MNSPFSKGDTPLVFPQFENEDEMSQSEICIRCSGCCNYVVLPIDKPKTKTNIDQYTWFLLHKNVQIYIDNDDSWNILFITPCTKLKANGGCSIYEKRPKICKDYSPESCSRVGKDHKVIFETPEAMIAYIEAEKEKRKRKKKTTI